MTRRLFFLTSKHIVRFHLLAFAIIGLMVCADSANAGEISMLYVAAKTGGAYFSWWKLLAIVLTLSLIHI